MGFSINCLEINASKETVMNNGSVYKNLLTEKDFEKRNFKLPKRFFFNDFYKREPDGNGNLIPNAKESRLDSDLFFGKNINIQAIVGMNGCGKSSLLDLMYMAVNNFAFMYERGKKRAEENNLWYVRNLFVSIYFSNEDDEFRLVCFDETVELQIKFDGQFVPFVDDSQNINASFNLDVFSTSDFPTESNKKLYYLLQNFFYTIVSNYSVQSFLPLDYIQKTYAFARRVDVDSNSNEIVYEKAPIGASWIQGIFPKNDGYVRPIVVTPKRDSYGIDMVTEKELAKYRELSLLIWSRNNGKQLLEGYDIFDVYFHVDEKYILDKVECKSVDEALFVIDQKIEPLERKDNLIPSNLDYLMVAKRLNVFPESPKLARLTLAIMLEKIRKITRYPPYEKYGNDGSKSIFPKLSLEPSINDASLSLNFGLLLTDMEKDKSHVVTKILQMYHFLNRDWSLDVDLCKKLNSWYDSGFKLSDYEKVYGCIEGSLEEIICNLPPSLFKYEVILKKSSNENELVSVNQLSSGESQMIQVLSSHMYHIRNLLSIKESNKQFYKSAEFDKLRPEYNCINLVFDEVEICFHPEYQRKFVNTLVKMLQNLGMTDACMFNIFVVTHSPFVLSDLPKQNILYLKEGTSIDVKCETFGQNIGALLADSFFINYYVGDFAKKKVNMILDEFEKDKSMPREIFERKIEILGDPLLKRQMLNYHDLHKV